MKFTLSWLFLEMTLICIWLATAFTPILNPWDSMSYSEAVIKLILRTVVFLVSGGAIIGGLKNRPGAGALVGLALSVLVCPLVILFVTGSAV